MAWYCTACLYKDWWRKQNITLINLLFRQNFPRDFMLQEAEDNQGELKLLINKLNNNYNPTSDMKKQEKEDTFKSAKKL